MPKVLICASNAVHIRNFHLPYLRYFKQRGYEVHVAVADDTSFDDADVVHAVPIKKSLLSFENISAAFMIRRLIKKEQFGLIVVHTSLAALVVRVGALFMSLERPPIINTVHGYFFWKGCGLVKRVLYYLPEWFLRGVTDGIIVMNEEDEAAAQKLVRKGGSVIKVHGMGVDTGRFIPAGDQLKYHAREILNIPHESFVLVYAAEFSKRKNHQELLDSFEVVTHKAPDVMLLLCGTGSLENHIKAEAARRGLLKSIRFLGWCDQMETIYAAADLAVSSSISEGLPFNIMEAQLCALPVVASKIRGHVDLIENGRTGYCYTPGNHSQLAALILAVMELDDRGKSIGAHARLSALQYSLEVAYAENVSAYESIAAHCG